MALVNIWVVMIWMGLATAFPQDPVSLSTAFTTGDRQSSTFSISNSDRRSFPSGPAPGVGVYEPSVTAYTVPVFGGASAVEGVITATSQLSSTSGAFGGSLAPYASSAATDSSNSAQTGSGEINVAAPPFTNTPAGSVVDQSSVDGSSPFGSAPFGSFAIIAPAPSSTSVGDSSNLYPFDNQHGVDTSFSGLSQTSAISGSAGLTESSSFGSQAPIEPPKTSYGVPILGHAVASVGSGSAALSGAAGLAGVSDGAVIETVIPQVNIPAPAPRPALVYGPPTF